MEILCRSCRPRLTAPLGLGRAGFDVGSRKRLYLFYFALVTVGVSTISDVLGEYLPVVEREMDDLLLHLF